VLEGAAIRPREPAEIVGDIRRLTGEHGARYIFFTDSVFNDAAGHYLDVIAEMERQQVNVPWTAFFKPAPTDDATIERMKRTGLQAVEIGSDAPSDTTLRGLAKDFTFDDIVRYNNLFAAHKVPAAHYFMFGCPGETPATVAEGIANIRRLSNAVVFVFMGVRILPGTALHRLAIAERVIREDQSLLEPAYYVSPQVARPWLEEALRSAFKDMRHVVFPPDALDSTLGVLHKLGYSGSVWDMLVSGDRRVRRRTSSPAPG
jgi:radical SAM superfamily enzyme YgiQ (UPF0313 family)